MSQLANGVPFVPGMKVWAGLDTGIPLHCFDTSEPRWSFVEKTGSGHLLGGKFCFSVLYSSREAAIDASIAHLSGRIEQIQQEIADLEGMK